MNDTQEDRWFAVAGDEFGIVGGKPVAYWGGSATVMSELGHGKTRPRAMTDDLVNWARMKRAMLATLVSRLDEWIPLAVTEIEAEEAAEAALEADERESSE